MHVQLINRNKRLCKIVNVIGCSWHPDFFSLSRVLRALTRKFKLHQDVSLYSIANKCPQNFTGADMYALCADAWFHAAKRKVSLVSIIFGFILLVLSQHYTINS